MRPVLSAFLALLISSALAGDFDHGAYRPSTLADAAANLDIDPRADYWFDASHQKYRITAMFTGQTRPTDPAMERFISQWASVMGHPEEYARMFSVEVEIEQSGVKNWMLLQDSLVQPWSENLPDADGVELYVLLLGARDRVPIFAIGSFSAISSNN